MFSFPASCPGERAIIVFFEHQDEYSGGWAGCDFNQAYFYLCVINMHGRGNWREGEKKWARRKWMNQIRGALDGLWNCDSMVHDMCAGWIVYGFMRGKTLKRWRCMHVHARAHMCRCVVICVCMCVWNNVISVKISVNLFSSKGLISVCIWGFFYYYYFIFCIIQFHTKNIISWQIAAFFYWFVSLNDQVVIKITCEVHVFAFLSKTWFSVKLNISIELCLGEQQPGATHWLDAALSLGSFLAEWGTISIYFYN